MERIQDIYDTSRYSFEKLDFLWVQSNKIEEDFYFMVLDTLFQKANLDKSEVVKFNQLLSDMHIDSSDLGIIRWSSVDAAELVATIQEIPKWKNGWAPKAFEQWWEKVCRYLFEDSFVEYIAKTQVANDNGLDIRDLILMNNYRRDGSVIEGFWWRIAAEMYSSNFITVEFKNYTEDAAQSVFFTTEKYLSKPGMGYFGLIFTREWLSNSSWKLKQLDLLRWSSKKESICLLNLSQDDLVKMIMQKQAWTKPESYLLEKFFELQTQI